MEQSEPKPSGDEVACRVRKEITTFADILPPRTYFMDWHMVGWPASLIVPCALSASLIALFLVTARRNRPWRSLTVFALCVSLFFLADFVVYEVGRKHQNLRRTPRDRLTPDWPDKKADEFDQKHEPPASPKD